MMRSLLSLLALSSVLAAQGAVATVDDLSGMEVDAVYFCNGLVQGVGSARA